MKKLTWLLSLTVSLTACFPVVAADSGSTLLWYSKPGTAWNDSLPIGNGRMGAMMAGQPAKETIYLNEDTIWSGKPNDYTNTGAHQHLEELRQLIRAEKHDDASKFGAEHSLGVPRRQKAYQHLGLLHFAFPGHEKYTEYHRQLDMSTGLVDVRYKSGGATFTRQILASHPDQVIAMQLTCDEPGKLAFEARFSSQHAVHAVRELDGKLVIEGTTQAKEGDPKGLCFQGQLHVEAVKGSVKVEGGVLTVTGADSATVRFVAATNYVNYQDISADPEKRCNWHLAGALKSSFKQTREKHVADHSGLFNRVSMKLDAPEADAGISTDQLVQQCRDGRHSPLLDAQIYQFARYLTIAGARPGTQPLNLVGIWAENRNAPWGGKWTLNINAELNAWPVETGNLAECHEPLLMLLEDLKATGSRVAMEHYKCNGFVAHHNTDLWRGSAPVDTALHGLWPMGGAWLSRHVYEHYDFSRDKEYLRKYYPTIKAAAEFFVGYLTEDKDGYLSTCPAISFEESFRKKDGTPGRLTYGPTMDNQILRDLFANCISASEALNVDEEFRGQIRNLCGKLRPNQVDSDTGRLMEWAFPAEKAFRGNGNSGQTAPLWGVSPGREITPQGTPDLAAAAVKYLKFHIPRTYGYETEGSWVTGTRVNALARLGQSQDAYAEIDKVASRRLWPNLMMSFYGKNYFQIDGNMGTASGIVEMIMQSHRRTKTGDPIIDLLPALPEAWKSGTVTGLRARGAFELDLKWKDGSLAGVKIRSNQGTPLTLTSRGESVALKTEAGEVIMLDGSLKRLR